MKIQESKYYEEATYLSLVRNCLRHNGGRIDARLASPRTMCKRGAHLSISEVDVSEAVNTLRKFAYQIDQAYESGSKEAAV
jgi:hypothetical protein